MATTVAEIVVSALRASGVQRVYGIPGDSLSGFTDALRRDGTIARRGASVAVHDPQGGES